MRPAPTRTEAEADPPPTGRQLKASETRARLIAAAATLFAANGYRETTVEKIALQAGVAKGTFFVHFPAKEAVAVELVRRQTRAALKAREAALSKGPLAALRASVLTLGDQAGISREVCRAVATAALDNPAVTADTDALYDEVLKAMIGDARQAVAAGELPRRYDAELFARALMASFLGTAFQFCSNQKGPSMAKMLVPLVDNLVAGFQGGKPRRIR